MTVATKKPRRRYQFSNRDEAEKQYNRQAHESQLRYFALIGVMFNKVFFDQRKGDYRVQLIKFHGTTERELSTPVLIVTYACGSRVDNQAWSPSVEVVDAYDWSSDFRNRPIYDLKDRDAFDLRSLAEEVYRQLKD